ncbi:NAD(P)H-binding protein [Micromonospora sp. NPDC049230]|uniref:NAD(P)-dependent oxidoreductase n=1 Tax=Micromonospora sp. NPDC049230 TaxID=3155502 RepID=UPI0033EF7278
MSRITVIGGTGYAGSAIVAEAATRGHQVTSLSRSAPTTPVPNATYRHGDATDEATLSAAVEGADVVVAALAPRGPLAATFRDVYRAVARLADAAGVPLFVVGGYSSLRPAPGADRFVADLSQVPAELHDEIRAGAALIIEDLPATPATLDWVFVSPALRFGAWMPSERLGRYRLGDDVAIAPEDGGAISAADYALGFVDLIEKGDHHRAQVNLGN